MTKQASSYSIPGSQSTLLEYQPASKISEQHLFLPPPSTVCAAKTPTWTRMATVQHPREGSANYSEWDEEQSLVSPGKHTGKEAISEIKLTQLCSNTEFEPDKHNGAAPAATEHGYPALSSQTCPRNTRCRAASPPMQKGTQYAGKMLLNDLENILQLQSEDQRSSVAKVTAAEFVRTQFYFLNKASPRTNTV